MNLINNLIVGTLPYVPKPIVAKFAGKYIAGATLNDAMNTVRSLNAMKAMTTVDVLGFGPTLRKAYHQPQSEPAVFYALVAMRNLTAILSAMPDALLVVDDDGQILLRNTPAEHLLVFFSDRLAVSLPLARGPGDLQFQPGNGRSQGPRAVLSGRILLDVAPLWRQLKGAGHEEPSFACESLASEVRSLAQLCESQGLLDVAMQRSRLTGLPLDRATASVAAFDFLYLIELGRRGYVAPTFQRP